MEDIDFELELIHRDLINVSYIIKRMAKMKQAKASDVEKQKKTIIGLLGGDIQLRSKRELIEKFIAENLQHIEDVENIPEEFEK